VCWDGGLKPTDLRYPDLRGMYGKILKKFTIFFGLVEKFVVYYLFILE
jgi:hypothetical protein